MFEANSIGSLIISIDSSFHLISAMPETVTGIGIGIGYRIANIGESVNVMWRMQAQATPDKGGTIVGFHAALP